MPLRRVVLAFFLGVTPATLVAQEGTPAAEPETATAAAAEAAPEAAPEASPEAAPEVAPEAAPEAAPETAPAAAPAAAPETAPATQPGTAPEALPPPEIGDPVDGWVIVAITSGKRLFDGRPTEERCGYMQDVVVERAVSATTEEEPQGEEAAATRKRLARTQLKVTCVRGQTGLVPGPARLVKTADMDPLAPSKPVEAATGQPATPAQPDDGFAPVDPAVVTRPPELLNGFDHSAAPTAGREGQPVEGTVVVEIDVRRDGTTRDARVYKGADPLLDQMSVAAARTFEWRPAESEGAPVDVILRHTIKWERAKREVELADTPFRKGELSSLGNVQLVNARSSFGVGLGAATIDDVIYGVVRPDLNMHIGPFSLGLGAPLRFEVFDASLINLAEPSSYQDGLVNAGRFRTEDWDRFFAFPYTDMLRPLKFLTWGRKEDNVYVDFNRVRAITIGHGQLVRRYAPNVDIDESNLFGEVDAYHDFGGVELMTGPLPVPRLLGGLVFVKPLGLFRDDYLSKSWSIGLSYVNDLNVPTSIATSVDPGSDRVQYPIDRGRFIYPNRDALVGSYVQGAGIDTELKVFKWEFVDLKLYLDYSHLFLPGVPDQQIAAFSAGGATMGGLLRMSWGSRPVRELDEETAEVRQGMAQRETKAAHAARFRLEAKTFHPQYLPSYFNSLYEHDKFQFGFGSVAADERATLPTKAAYLATQAGEPWRAGYFLEATYCLVDWLAVTAVYEDAWALGGASASVPAGRNVILHAETQGLGFLQLFSTYHYRNFELEDWSKMFRFQHDNEILYLGGRLQILIAALNLSVQRGNRIDTLAADIGTDRSYEAGGPSYPHSSVGLRNQWNAYFDIELGWQF